MGQGPKAHPRGTWARAALGGVDQPREETVIRSIANSIYRKAGGIPGDADPGLQIRDARTKEK
jgi:hypothetical protein